MSDEIRNIREQDAEPREPAGEPPSDSGRRTPDRVEEAPAQTGPAGEPISRRFCKSNASRINRRELLKLVPVVALGAFAIPNLQQPLLNEGSGLQRLGIGKALRAAPPGADFSNSQVAPFDRSPTTTTTSWIPEVDFDKWTLTVEGLVQRPGNYKLQQIQAFPKVVQNTRHVCVEGWDVVGNFGGTRASDFLRAIGADLTARYLEAECADDYYESIDMETMLHPQTLFCYEMYGQPLDRGHGAPLRLQMPTKLGYKQAKYLDTDSRDERAEGRPAGLLGRPGLRLVRGIVSELWRPALAQSNASRPSRSPSPMSIRGWCGWRIGSAPSRWS